MAAPIRRLLVANRGEIALRIIRACRELGIESVAVCSTADVRAPHVRAADRAVTIGPPHPRDSYLNAGAIIDAARGTGAGAIHPGYGFLSEDPDMAAACAGAGLVWVGPPADVIARLGSKIEARRLMRGAGVPIVPGETPADQTGAGLAAAAERVGYPLLLKASAGGGGRGMRTVRAPGRLRQAISEARREAESAFGNGTLYVERQLIRPRHVEVQIMADDTGRVVHLQRAGLLDTAASPEGGRREPRPRPDAGGTRAPDGGRGFRRPRRRLPQCGNGGVSRRGGRRRRGHRVSGDEHPASGRASGDRAGDRPRPRARPARGGPAAAPCRGRRTRIAVRGHAIECRVYAERPAEGFLPDAGTLLRYREPAGPGIRVDAGVVEGGVVSPAYDALLAKLVVHGETRGRALARARAALARYVAARRPHQPRPPVAHPGPPRGWPRGRSTPGF